VGSLLSSAGDLLNIQEKIAKATPLIAPAERLVRPIRPQELAEVLGVSAVSV
jgi:hypothetical protein